LAFTHTDSVSHDDIASMDVVRVSIVSVVSRKFERLTCP